MNLYTRINWAVISDLTGNQFGTRQQRSGSWSLDPDATLASPSVVALGTGDRIREATDDQ
jgi:hypothetical protein